MELEHKGAGRRDPTSQDPRWHDRSKAPEAGERRRGLSKPQDEQRPQGGGINKPELHPAKELPLPFEPNRPRHAQQTGRLDPEVERLMRAYAEAEAEGDPKKAERLFKRYRKDSSLVEYFEYFKLHGAPTLATRGLDVSKLMEEPKKQE